MRINAKLAARPVKIHIPSFENARVLVCGDLMLDRYWHGDTSRISPEAPVPVVRVGQEEDRPGGAGNVALNIAALGARPTLLGITGDDAAAQILDDELTAAGVTCRFERVRGIPTITKLRVLSRHQQLIRLDFEDSLTSVNADLMTGWFNDSLADHDLIVCSDYGKGTLRNIADLIALARGARKPVLIDPKGNDYSIYRGATIITPNYSEFEAVVGRCTSEQDIVARGRRLMEQLELQALLITRGEHGMTLLQRHAEPLHLPAQAKEVFDVTGAGDTVISVLAAALAAGEELVLATALANLAAGIVVGKLGTATVSVPEMRRALHEADATGQGVVNEAQLLLAIDDARAHNETIVMTNGCFDILHPGHVAYLEQARQLGDRLIVAVNDDNSVRRLKGADRPVNPLDHRMAILSALKCVDWVVPFSEDTPERLICRVHPDFLVKGGDYRPEQVAGHECVTVNGGQVVILDYVAGHSTTGIIERMRAV